ncbi:uncharacterized protein LOC141855194 isoform X2 [Brevipalpus obovatus]|uniref:uncharacterized protein LOC141855194 isoform X2 n=1 Tax=Brevipalpus obovatus TaxID=246614 RepID=UPI003D9F1730
MDSSKNDLLRMLYVLEGELQAKEIVISILKTEQVRRLLHPCYDRHRWAKQQPSYSTQINTIIPRSKHRNAHSSDPQHQVLNDKNTPKDADHDRISNRFATYIDPSDPYVALLRDTYCAYDPTLAEDNSCRLICTLQYHQLRNLIEQQRQLRSYLESQLHDLGERYNQCFQELEVERAKNTNHGQLIRKIELLEKDNESVRCELEAAKQTLIKEKEREKAMVLCLIAERKELIVRLIEESQKNSELIEMLQNERSRIGEMVEGLEEESKRSLLMESELEKLADKVKGLELVNCDLSNENEKLKKELESYKTKRLVTLGEGARSTIVTVNSSDHKTVPTAQLGSALDQSQVGIKLVSPIKMTDTIRPKIGSAIGSSPQSTVKNVSQVSDAGANKSDSIAGSNVSETLASSSTPPSPQELDKISSKGSSRNNTVASPNPSKTPVAPGKVMIASGSPQQAPQKKMSSAIVGSARGLPPPIPPNKPILPASALKERSKELQQSVSAKAKIFTSPKSTNLSMSPQGEKERFFDYL